MYVLVLRVVPDTEAGLHIALQALRLLYTNLDAVVSSADPVGIATAGLRAPSGTVDALLPLLFQLTTHATGSSRRHVGGAPFLSIGSQLGRSSCC